MFIIFFVSSFIHLFFVLFTYIFIDNISYFPLFYLFLITEMVLDSIDYVDTLAATGRLSRQHVSTVQYIHYTTVLFCAHFFNPLKDFY
jgi:hypothetical protein